MRVAIIVPGFSASDSDWCIPAVLSLVRRLAASVDVEIFTLRYPLHARTYEVAGARVHALGGGDTRRLGKIGLLARALARVAAVHRARPFDVLHALWADEPGVVAVAAARVVGRPAIVSVMGGELVYFRDLAYGVQGSRAGRFLVRFALGRASLVTAGSNAVAQAVPDTVAGRLRLMPLGVDVDRFRLGAGGVPLAGRFKILHVASLVPVKDQMMLLAAMRDVRRSVPAHLHIVGDGPLLKPLQATAADYGLDGSVTFHGAVPHDRLPDFYQGTDVCVVSSRHESQSMVALEAGACGRPVVGTAVGILPELGPAARVVSPGDAAALARELVSLALDAAARDRMGRHARALAESTFALDRTVPALLAVYAEVGRQSFRQCPDDALSSRLAR